MTFTCQNINIVVIHDSIWIPLFRGMTRIVAERVAIYAFGELRWLKDSFCLNRSPLKLICV
jgi:hypothetical protein